MSYDYERYNQIIQKMLDVMWRDPDELEIGEDISDLPEVKIIFDGHGDLEEEIDGEIAKLVKNTLQADDRALSFKLEPFPGVDTKTKVKFLVGVKMFFSFLWEKIKSFPRNIIESVIEVFCKVLLFNPTINPSKGMFIPNVTKANDIGLASKLKPFIFCIFNLGPS